MGRASGKGRGGGASATGARGIQPLEGTIENLRESLASKNPDLEIIYEKHDEGWKLSVSEDETNPVGEPVLDAAKRLIARELSGSGLVPKFEDWVWNEPNGARGGFEANIQPSGRANISVGDLDPNRSALHTAAQRIGGIADGMLSNRAGIGQQVRDAEALLDKVEVPEDFSNKSDLERKIRDIRDDIYLSGGGLGGDLSSDKARDIEQRIINIFDDYTDELERNPSYIGDIELAEQKSRASR